MYAIKDPLTGSSATTALYASPRTNLCSSSASTSCFVQVTLTDSSGVRTATSSVTADFKTMNGWFADQPESGERINTDATLQLGTLAYVSNIPSTTGACSVGGTSYLNYVNFATGLAVPGASNEGVLLSTGLSSSAVLALTTSGKVVAYTKSSDGGTVTTTVPTSSSSTGTRRLTWRELIVGQ